MGWLVWIVIGFGIGVAATIPLVYIASRRTESKVRRLEQRTRAAERLAEQATLTSGLTHEIKNPLSTIGMNIDLLQEDLRDHERDAALAQPQREAVGRIQRRLGTVDREIVRLSEILEDFLRFAGRVKLSREERDVNALVRELIDFYAPQADAGRITIRGQFDANPGTAWVDGDHLKQALLNLMINATQAMVNARDAGVPHGGCDELLLRTARQRAGDELTIDVIDTGPGIDAERAKQVFQPYFSTRKGGTGLGLPTTRRIVEEHGGTITLHSEPGRGTDFTVSLPAAPPQTVDDDSLVD